MSSHFNLALSFFGCRKKMTTKFIVLFLTVAGLNFAGAANPQQCTETSLTYREASPNFILTFAATLNVTSQANKNLVIITNIQANVTNPSFSISSICAVDVTTRNVSNCVTSVSTMMVSNQTTATITFDYELYNGNVTMFGRVTDAASDFHPIFIINDAEGCQVQINNTILCGYPLVPSGNKLIFFLTEFRLNITRDSLPTAMTGRLIIRDGTQTLMAENTPFTPANSCQNFNSNYGHANSVLTTSMCCTNFLPNSDGSTAMTIPGSSTAVTGQSNSTTTPSSTTTSGNSVINPLNAIVAFVVMFFFACVL